METVLVDEIVDNPQYKFRLKDASRRIQERAGALATRMDAATNESPVPGKVLPVGHEVQALTT